SVILGSYNHAAFIGPAIDSVLNQTFTDFELIIADDASIDGTAEIIRSYQDRRIIPILRDTNKGLCRNFNLAVAQARGEYIAQLASDDRFAPEKLARQVAVLDAQPQTGVVFIHAEIMGADGLPYKRHPLRHMKYLFNHANQTRHQWLALLFNNNCLSASSAMMRAKARHEIGYYDERFMRLQDYDLWVRFALAGHDLHIIQEQLTSYRHLRRAAQMSAKSVSVYKQVRFEHSKLLQRFLGIATLEEFRSIFPNAPEAKSAGLIGLYLFSLPAASQEKRHSH
ncbi:MAG: glycosyltransferase, partial [Rickettsiales bacterium]|nr:glycosyltransferase [Rickettsiales bacterium]